MNQMLPRPQFWADTASQCKTRFSLVGELLTFMLLYLIAVLAQGFLLAIPMTVWIMGARSGDLMAALMAGESPQSVVNGLMEELPDWLVLVSLFASVAMGAAAVVYCRKFQKRDLASMGLRGKKPALEYALGCVFGLTLFLIAAGVGAAMDGFRLLREAPTAERLVCGLLALPGCMVQGAALELLIRGYYTPTVGGRYPTAVALAVSTLTPALLQSGASLFSLVSVNGMLLGLLLGVWALKRGNILSACAIRGAWLFAAGFLFEFAPAGEHSGVRLLDVDIDGFRPLLTGGDYGPQASICVTVVLLAGVMLALALKPMEPAAPRPRDEQAEKYL